MRISDKKQNYSKQILRGFITTATSAALMFSTSLSAYAQPVALPNGGQVVSGSASISNPSNHSLLVNQQSDHAIINWDGFSVGSGNKAHFENGTGATLNRVTGNSISAIDGSLTATGSLYLINDNGIIIGKDGIVNTGGSFIGSTLDISNEDFLNGGDNTFAGNSTATIINLGKVESLGGSVGFIAHTILNEGDITANNGTVGLAAGREILLRDLALNDGKFVVKIGNADGSITEKGMIQAANVELRTNGGNIYALAGNHKDSSINATGTSKKGGRIFLTAGAGKITTRKKIKAKRVIKSKKSGGDIFINADLVNVAGLLDASGLNGNGGHIDIGGKTKISLEAATLDVSGAQGGGRIQVGGEYQGGKDLTQDQVENVQTLTIDQHSTLKADATGENGDGGTVIAWADDTTIFNGDISARGGSQSGNGGMVETSGKRRLGIGSTASVNASAVNGTTGEWLLDPTNITIADGGTNTLAELGNAGNLIIDASVINAATADVNLIAGITINFEEAINNTNAGMNLTATAPEINIARDINTAGSQTYNGHVVYGGNAILPPPDY